MRNTIIGFIAGVCLLERGWPAGWWSRALALPTAVRQLSDVDNAVGGS